MVTPPWTSLRELENASWQLQRDDAEDDPHYRQWLSLLIAPGSSLGGARPKAGVRDEQGELWIAKFPGRNDERDMGAWEIVAHRLAKEAGVEVAEARLERFGARQHTFLVRRFDRVPGAQGARRIHFASAMTLLGHNDGADHTEGASYLDLAELIIRQGAEPERDLRELWRRIVFSIAIRNTDDHLRNHGFLLTPGGWRLSPAFDLNADPDGRALSLNITENDNALDFDVAREAAVYFRLEPREAGRVIDQVRRAVAKWREVALELGIGRAEVESMAVAFSG
jgi:serine/threonine-protein kinase HipA